MELTAPQNGIAHLRPKFQSLEEFTKIVNSAPPPEGIAATPDGRAKYMAVSFIESKLDEIYLRQWGATNVNIQIVANEILVWLTLWVIDPITGVKIERPGFAAVQITVDKAPANLEGSAKNAWALDLNNKKPNACYLSFPKAKSEAIKNAAQSLGKIFGRDINRKLEDTPEDFYGQEFSARETLESIKKEMEDCKTGAELKEVFNKYPDHHKNATFMAAFTAFKNQLNLKK